MYKMLHLIQRKRMENMENDFTEITAKVQELAWKESKQSSKCCLEHDEDQGS